MEKAAEQGSAIAAAVEGVERQWGPNYSGLYLCLEILWVASVLLEVASYIKSLIEIML